MQVHLRVDTSLTHNKLDVVAYVARHLTLGDRSTSLAQEFQQVPCEVRTVEVERLGSKLSTLLQICHVNRSNGMAWCPGIS